MLKNIIFVIFCFSSIQSISQNNLVLNPSFEEVSGPLKCYLYDVGKFPLTNWSSASEGSIDAFSMKLSNKCVMHPLNDAFADQKPRTGANYVGFTSVYNDEKEYREYVRGNLSEPLEVGSTYKIRFYVCLSAFASAATNNIGLAFINNKTPIFPHVDPLPIKPHVNYSGKPITQADKWTLLTFEFVATEPNLNAFIIGNFFYTNETDFKIVSDKLPVEAYMLLDDVSVTKMDIVFDLPSEVCEGTNVDLLNISKNGVSGTWNSEFNPTATKTYIFTSTDGLLFTKEIKIFPKTEFELVHFCENYKFNVDAKFIKDKKSNIKNYQWKLNGKLVSSNSTSLEISNFSDNLKDSNLIELTIIDSNNCEYTKSVLFKKANLCTIQKEVSPNLDGINDYLDLESFGGVQLIIYNRFGNVVYSIDNYFNEWKGQLEDNSKLPNGDYYYQVENKRGEILNGWIQLLY